QVHRAAHLAVANLWSRPPSSDSGLALPREPKTSASASPPSEQSFVASPVIPASDQPSLDKSTLAKGKSKEKSQKAIEPAAVAKERTAETARRQSPTLASLDKTVLAVSSVNPTAATSQSKHSLISGAIAPHPSALASPAPGPMPNDSSAKTKGSPLLGQTGTDAQPKAGSNGDSFHGLAKPGLKETMAKFKQTIAEAAAGKAAADPGHPPNTSPRPDGRNSAKPNKTQSPTEPVLSSQAARNDGVPTKSLSGPPAALDQVPSAGLSTARDRVAGEKPPTQVSPPKSLVSKVKAAESSYPSAVALEKCSSQDTFTEEPRSPDSQTPPPARSIKREWSGSPQQQPEAAGSDGGRQREGDVSAAAPAKKPRKDHRYRSDLALKPNIEAFGFVLGDAKAYKVCKSAAGSRLVKSDEDEGTALGDGEFDSVVLEYPGSGCSEK
ncbi:hypothetical protein HDU91_001642, partial [Kappamyces sp. JEL0680]